MVINKTVVFLTLIFSLFIIYSKESEVALNDLNKLRLLPFSKICVAFSDLSKRSPEEGLLFPSNDKSGQADKNIEKCIEKIKEIYFESLKEMNLKPYSFNDKDFSFRILIIMPNSPDIVFLNTSIQIYEEKDSFYLRMSFPFPSPYSSKYDCYTKKKSDYLIYKMTADEKNNIMNKTKNNWVFEKDWGVAFIDEKHLTLTSTQRRIKPYAFVFETIFKGKYYASYSEFILADKYDALVLKEKSDSNLNNMAREFFEFAYATILTRDVRYFEFDKKWEDLKPFEGCKAKEEKKPEAGSEKSRNN